RGPPATNAATEATSSWRRVLMDERSRAGGGAQRSGTTAGVDGLPGVGELAVVVFEHLHVLLDHVADHHDLAVLGEGGTLRPRPDRRLAGLGERIAVELVEHHRAVRLVLWRILGPGRPGVCHPGDPPAVRRHHHALEGFVADVGRPEHLAGRVADE